MRRPCATHGWKALAKTVIMSTSTSIPALDMPSAMAEMPSAMAEMPSAMAERPTLDGGAEAAGTWAEYVADTDRVEELVVVVRDDTAAHDFDMLRVHLAETR